MTTAKAPFSGRSPSVPASPAPDAVRSNLAAASKDDLVRLIERLAADSAEISARLDYLSDPDAAAKALQGRIRSIRSNKRFVSYTPAESACNRCRWHHRKPRDSRIRAHGPTVGSARCNWSGRVVPIHGLRAPAHEIIEAALRPLVEAARALQSQRVSAAPLRSGRVSLAARLSSP